VWSARHRGICVLLWFHVVALPVVGTLRGDGFLHSVAETAAVAALALGATLEVFGRSVRSTLTTAGLLASSAALVHFFDGLIEMHFHFFVMIAVVSLYQAWRPYLIAVGFVMAHHVIAGTLAPDKVFNHGAAEANPWLFAALHGSFILAESIACLIFWKVNEEALDAERSRRAELEEANRALSNANQEVSDLVAMLSHDLRTPLAVVNGFAEMAIDSWPELRDDERLEFMRRVEHSGRQLEQMVDDTLTVSALSAEGLKPRPTAVRVDQEVRDLLVALQDPLPEVDLSGLAAASALVDRGHLSQVLTNLVTNAAKYGAAPYSIQSRQVGDEVVVRVSDAGPGVTPAFERRLFDRYTRSDEARAGDAKGTGLGLFIARSLLVANHGEIGFARPPGGGAAFSVVLPAAGSVSDDRAEGEPQVALANG
jgi:signal transduction histidine kinase